MFDQFKAGSLQLAALLLDAFAEMNRADFERYGKLIREANIKVDSQ